METEKSLSEQLQKIDELELTASIQTKKGWLYAVISYTDEKGHSKAIWRATGIKDVPGNKKAAKNKKTEIIVKFKEDLKEKIKKEYVESLPKLEPEQLQIEYDTTSDELEVVNNLTQQRMEKYKNMSFLDFLSESLEEFKTRVADTTYDAWKSCYDSRICDYFRVITLQERTTMINPNIDKPIYYQTMPKLIEISQFDIEDFLKWLYDCGLKGSTADKYYEFFNLAFARAVRKKIIKRVNNPMTDVTKPKVEPYIADYYKPSELKKLFDIVRDDIIEVPILFAGTYGLRRSEVLGLKWSAIDFEADTFVIKHTVTKVTGRGENQKIQCRDLTKSKYGYRTYPLTSELRKALLKQKIKIEVNKRTIFKNKYVQQTEEYICVRENGELLKPDFITKRFPKLAQENDLKKIRLHDIRHSVGSLLAANNVNLRQIQDFLGHGSIKSTVRYSHLQYEGKQNSVDLVTSVVNS